MKVLATLTILLATGSAASLRADLLAGPVTNAANGHLYYLLSEGSWQDAEAEAIELGGHLVTINNEAEQEWVFSTFGSHGGISRSLWIGLWKAPPTADFAWVSGEEVGYSNWLPGQPDNSPVTGGEAYVHFLNAGNEYGHPGGLWNDLASPNTGFPTFNPLCGVVEVIPSAPPALTIRLTQASQVEICHSTTTGRRYQLQYRSEETTPEWINRGTPVSGNGGNVCLTEGLDQNPPQRFYRVISLPW